MPTTRENVIAFGSFAEIATTASDLSDLLWKAIIPTTDHSWFSWTTHTFDLAAESAAIPFRSIMGNKRKLCRKNPPLAFECKVTTFHLRNRNILSAFNLANMLIQSSAQGAFTFCR